MQYMYVITNNLPRVNMNDVRVPYRIIITGPGLRIFFRKPLSYINRIRLQTSLVDKWGRNQRIMCHITLHTNCVALKTICVVEKSHHLLELVLPNTKRFTTYFIITSALLSTFSYYNCYRKDTHFGHEYCLTT